MNVNEIALLKKLMDREGQFAAHPKHRSVEIRTRTQMRDSSKKFLRVPLLLQRVSRIGRANKLNAGGFEFPLLSLSRRGDEIAFNDRRGARGEVGQVLRTRRAGI